MSEIIGRHNVANWHNTLKDAESRIYARDAEFSGHVIATVVEGALASVVYAVEGGEAVSLRSTSHEPSHHGPIDARSERCAVKLAKACQRLALSLGREVTPRDFTGHVGIVVKDGYVEDLTFAWLGGTETEL